MLGRDLRDVVLRFVCGVLFTLVLARALRLPILGKSNQKEHHRSTDNDADEQGCEEAHDVVDSAKHRNDGTAMHNMVLDPECTCQGACYRTADDVCRNDLQWSGRGKRNCAFSNAEEPHEERGDSGVFFCFVEPSASD